MEFYKGKKILITGNTGFKGSWLTLLLNNLGAVVCGYSLNPPTEPALFNIVNLENDIHHNVGDIRDLENLKKVFYDFKPEIVFHLAAQALVRLSYSDPKTTYETNVIGTLNVFEASRVTKSVRAIVNVTTDKCYENKEWVWGYRENEPLGGFDPYSSSKACSELVTSAYRNSFFKTLGIGVATARAGNVIGGGDWAKDRLIPDMVKALSKNQVLLIRNPKAIRPWQHVLEPLFGYLLLGKKLYNNLEFADAWNFGPNIDDVLNVEEVVKSFITIFGKGKYEIDNSGQPHEALLLKLDISKAKHYLGWKPRYDSSIAIEKTVEWYREYYYGNKKSIRAFTEKQIKKYLE